MTEDGMVPTVLDLNRTRVCGESSSEHSKTPHAMDARPTSQLPQHVRANANPEGGQRGMARFSFPIYLTGLKCCHCAIDCRTVLTRPRTMSWPAWRPQMCRLATLMMSHCSGMCCWPQCKANDKATRLEHTRTRKTKFFVRLCCTLEGILFVVPTKREGHFGRGSGCISINIGNSSMRTSRVIRMKPLYKNVGASSNQSATNFVVWATFCL
jgi:hypothetical protein